MAESLQTRHENWLRAFWGLLYVREGLQCYVDTKGKQQYQTSMNNVRNIKNKTLHDTHYELDAQTADDCLDNMVTILQDQQELVHDTFAQQGADIIRNIKTKIEMTPAIMTKTLQKWLQTNFDVDKYIKEIEGLLFDRLQKELKGFIVDEVRLEVKQSIDDRGNYERKHNMEDLRQRLAKYYQKLLNSASISLLLSDKNERLDKFYVPPKIVEKYPRKVDAVKKEKGTPVTAYRQLFC